MSNDATRAVDQRVPVGASVDSGAAVALGATIVLSKPSLRENDSRIEWVRGAVVRYERALTQYALHILDGDLEQARDLVQETFLRLCDQQQATVEGHLAEWLYTVCRNLAIDLKRRSRRLRWVVEPTHRTAVSEATPAESAELSDASDRVVVLLHGLPLRQQEVVRLKFKHGLSYKEIGQVMNLTPTNVGFILHTAIKALRERME